MKKKFLLLLPLIALTSCGAKMNLVASSKLDHSGIWKDNYYYSFNKELFDKDIEEVSLNKEKDLVFLSPFDTNFTKNAPDASSFDYYNDLYKDSYFQKNKLGVYDQNAREGFTSKLFDGQLFCYGNYEKARVQIKEEGFSSGFSKHLDSADYLYLNFKSSLDFKQHSPKTHLSSINLNIYLFGDTNYKFSYQINNIITNDGDAYVFYGFSLKDYDLKNTKEFAITYTLINDTYIDETHEDIDYALLLYELGFGNPRFS